MSTRTGASPAANSLSVILSSEQGPIPVGNTAVVSVVPAVSTVAYAVNDVVGAKMLFAGVGASPRFSGLIQQALVHCRTNQTAALDLIVFHADPTASTFTDNAALAVADADLDKISTVIKLTDWTNLGTPSFNQADALAKPFKGLTANLWGVLVTRTAMTLGSVTDIRVTLKTLQD